MGCKFCSVDGCRFCSPPLQILQPPLHILQRVLQLLQRVRNPYGGLFEGYMGVYATC